MNQEGWSDVMTRKGLPLTAGRTAMLAAATTLTFALSPANAAPQGTAPAAAMHDISSGSATYFSASRRHHRHRGGKGGAAAAAAFAGIVGTIGAIAAAQASRDAYYDGYYDGPYGYGPYYAPPRYYRPYGGYGYYGGPRLDGGGNIIP
jgi:hypothetical protein